jgi:hypothetical protein
MAYIIFNNDKFFKIAENEYDLNNLNIIKSDYTIIEDSQENFNLVKLGTKYPDKYNNNIVTYINQTFLFNNKNELQNYINLYKQQIKQFIDNNPNHQLFTRWNNYYNQLNSLNLDNITYPLSKSLEQYFNDLGQPSFNILQLP